MFWALLHFRLYSSVIAMTSEQTLCASGSIGDFPAAELFAELLQEKLDGSLRMANGDNKTVIYFKQGRPVYAVSNQRNARLFDNVLRRGLMSREDIVAVEGFVNDHVLAAHLRSASIVSAEAIASIFDDIVRNILIDALSWTSGTWEYLPLARVKDGLGTEVDLSPELDNYTRHMTNEYVLNRFRSFDEMVASVDEITNPKPIAPQDAFLLSRMSESRLRLSELVNLLPTSETETLVRVYRLWLLGALVRSEFRSAFGIEMLNKLRHLRVALKREAEQIDLSIHKTAPPETAESEAVELDLSESPDEKVFVTPSLDEYLARFSESCTYYDILGVDPDASESSFRTAYFGLAKAFHPDHFHNSDANTFKRVQDAFAELAKAHETLKDAATRELYDFKIRKEIAAREERKKTGATESASVQLEQAEQSFDRGFNLLMDGDADAATPLLARAVHYAPNNARYRAYYGKALSSNSKKRHQAEAEMQAALKLDPENANFRLMLAEFFVDVNLLKRAEGELKRLLAIFPSNREAQNLLADIQSRSS